MFKDGGRAEGSFELLKGFVGAGAPGQGLGLATEQGGQWGSMQTVVLAPKSKNIYCFYLLFFFLSYSYLYLNICSCIMYHLLFLFFCTVH